MSKRSRRTGPGRAGPSSADRRALARISRAIGADRDLVQSGGGNTSVKSADGKCLLVKASGVTLSDLTERSGWVALDLPKTLETFQLQGIGRQAPGPQHARVLEHLAGCARSGAGRPSVETLLHAQLDRVVIHSHPVLANAVNCGGGPAVLKKVPHGTDLPPLWMPYTTPGFPLADRIRRAAERFQKKHGAFPGIIFIGNHGIVVSAGTARAALALHQRWMKRLARYYGIPAKPKKRPKPDPALVRELALTIRRLHGKKDVPPLVRLSQDPELIDAAGNQFGALLAKGSLSPDHVVYTGPAAVYLARASVKELAAAVGRFKRQWQALPRVVVVRNLGVFVVGLGMKSLQAAEDLAASAVRIARFARRRHSIKFLRPADVRYVHNWEAERFRQRVAALAEGGPLIHKVAVVTGAASGLGKGIARGLVGAGCVTFFADIDKPGLQAAADEINAGNPSGFAIPLVMDVTDEAAVARAFDRIVATCGGLDICVNAAGIAPAYPITDFPVKLWRQALEVNLTGYFLVGREAARVMKAQGLGGSIVNLSSKSGLEASKANTAYNATKAGEIHIARGWALELGRDGIRVNAVAPGNVFEGSKIWNREYMKVCARKHEIPVEQLIPYYTSLTAMDEEIKPQDVANTVIFLCSDAARRITGQVLVVDAGQVMVR